MPEPMIDAPSQANERPFTTYDVDIHIYDEKSTFTITGKFKHPAHAAFSALEYFNFNQEAQNRHISFDNMSIHVKRARP